MHKRGIGGDSSKLKPLSLIFFSAGYTKIKLSRLLQSKIYTETILLIYSLLFASLISTLILLFFWTVSIKNKNCNGAIVMGDHGVFRFL